MNLKPTWPTNRVPGQLELLQRNRGEGEFWRFKGLGRVFFVVLFF